MQSHQVTGLVLIVGALATVVGIAAHPHHGPAAHGGLGQGQHLVVAVIVVGSFVITGVGLLRLLRSGPPQLSSDVAFIVLALAGACGSLAAISGHVVIPRFIEYKNAAQQQDQAIVDAIITHDSIRNATLTQTMFAAWAIAVLCLSISMLYSSLVWKIFGACGIALGLFLLLALALGRLQINMHHVGLVVFASAIWIIAIGSALCANKSFGELKQ
jgi:hypothetical protein